MEPPYTIADKCWDVLLDANPIPTVLLNADPPAFTVVFANEAYAAWMGLERAHAHVVDTGELQDTLQEVLRHRAAQKQSAVRYEFQLSQPGRPAVRYADVDCSPLPAEDGRTGYILCTFNDVTENMEARQREKTIRDEFIKQEKALTDSRNQYQALIESVEGVVWEAEASTFKFTYISNKIISILGYTPEQWLSDPDFWSEHIYEDDRDWAVMYCQKQTQEVLNHVFDYRMIKADGGIVWIKDLVSVITENGAPKLLRGVMIDVTESKLLSSLDHLEKNVLELAADKEEDLHRILVIYMRGIENLLPHMKCSLLQVREDKLYTLAAPSLPEDYIAAINGRPVGEQAGSCGTSAYRKEKVIVTDISTDVLWKDYRHLVLHHGLRACWSYPIIDSDNHVLAVFGLYYDEVKEPSDQEQVIIARSAAILKVILENRQRARMIEEATMLIRQGQELANFGNWQWDIRNNTVRWSEVLYDIYGVDKNSHVATYESYLSLLHADDRDTVGNIIFNALNTKQDIVFEERIIRPDGEVRHLKSWGRVLCDGKGNPEKMIGSCLDITAAKIAESQLWEVAWMQSHLVRAPLARLMGLVDVLIAEQNNDELLNYIMTAAHELDKVVRDISSKTVNKV